MVKHLKAFLLVAACCAIGCAVAPMPLTTTTYPVSDAVRIMVADSARDAIEALGDLTRATRKEQSACVESYGVLPLKGALVIIVYELGPSNAYDSDSLRVWTIDQKPFCSLHAVNLHSHIVNNEAWGIPSQWDLEHAYDWSEAPFKLLLSVGPKRPSKLTVYGLR